MNPLALLAWWKEILIALLVVAIGVQSYRLQGAQGERDILKVEIAERVKRDAMRDMQNSKNKERTDAEYLASSRRAARAVVRLDGPGIKPKAVTVAPSGDGGSACLDGGAVQRELAEWSGRTAERLTDLLQRHAGRLSPVAVEGEEVAAALRACQAWGRNLN